MSQKTDQAEANKSADATTATATATPTATGNTSSAKKGAGRPKASNSNTPSAKKTATKSSAGSPKKAASKAVKTAAAATTSSTKKKAGRPKESAAKTASANNSRTSSTTGAKANAKASSRNTAGNNPFTQAGNAAFGKNANTFNKGLEGLSASFMKYAQSQMEENVQAAQQLLNCRSIEDMTNVQTQFIQQSFDRFIQQTNKMAQSAANLAKESAEPINAKFEGFMQKMSGR